jgi:HEAT repeat protein
MSPLIQAVSHSNKQVRREAVWALARLGSTGKSALTALTGALRDSDLRVRLGAAQALASMGPDARAAIPSLIEALHDTNLVYCRLAAQALVRIGRAALPALHQASQASDTVVRREALWALKHLEEPSNLDSNQIKIDSNSSVWARQTQTLKSEPNPKATVQLSLRPKRIRQTVKIPLD